MRAVGGPGSQHGCWLLTYLLRAHPLHLCHYQQWHSQKEKQKEKHLLLTAMTLHISHSNLPFIGSRLGESARFALTFQGASVAQVWQIARLETAPAGDTDALTAMTPKTSASRGKCLNLTVSSICCRIISLEKRSSSYLCRSNVSLRNQSRHWLCIVAILSRHIWTMKCIWKPLIETDWIRFQLHSGFSMSPHIESREVESQQIAIVARGDKPINRKGEKKQQSIKQLN